jgi:hypothetical protein
MTWTISPEAQEDYFRLRRSDPRGPPASRATMLEELRDTCEHIEQTKVGHPRADGRLVYRGQQSRRYQYVVDPCTTPPTLVQVRGESERRQQGSKGTLGHEIRRRQEKHRK